MLFWGTVRNPESPFDAFWFWYFVPFWFYWYFLPYWFYHYLPFSNEILCKSVKMLTVAYALFDLTLNWSEQFQLAFVIFDLSTVSQLARRLGWAGLGVTNDRHGLGHGRARVSWFSASIHLCSKELHNETTSFLNSRFNFCNP